MNRFLLVGLVLGWSLALTFGLLWLAERRYREAAPARSVERPKAERVPEPPFPQNRDAAALAKADVSPEASGKTNSLAQPRASIPTLFTLDREDRIQWADDVRRALGLSEADAAALQASTQAYLDTYRDLQKRHLDVRKFEREQVEFVIDSFPSEGRAIFEGLTAIWRRAVDPSAWSEIHGRVAELFGGEKEGFGALRILVKARRETDGAGGVVTAEQYFTPAGDKAGSRTGLSISGDDDDQPVSEHLPHYSRLFKKP